MSVSLDDVRRVAALSKLEFTAEEMESLRAEMSKIIDFARQLDELPLDNLPETAYLQEGETQMREDEARPGLTREQVLQNAPKSRDGFIVVPRVIGGDK